jgi:DNA topoisomerase-1
MEQTLDEIASGEAQWLPYLKNFYLGENGLENQVKVRESLIDPNQSKSIILDKLSVAVRIGKYGPYLESKQGDEVIKASIPADLTPSDLNPEQVEMILRQKIEGPQSLGNYPETEEEIYILTGTYGPYIQLGEATTEKPKPKRVSLPKGMKIEDVTLEIAMAYLALPRTLGEHPETGGKIQANLGRFGPYVVHDCGKEGKDYRSLKKEDDLLTITLPRALELLAQPKRGGGRRTKKPLRELGLHPGDQEPVNIYDGPYGPYIKHGKTNAKIPEGESAENISLETALTALTDKVSAGKSQKKTTSRRKKSADG